MNNENEIQNQSISSSEINVAITNNPTNNSIDNNSIGVIGREGLFTNEEKAEVKKIFLSEIEKPIDDLIVKFKNETNDLKKDYIAFFGLFASFITFLSFEIQIFKNRENLLELIGVSAISLSFVMLFVVMINDISKDKITFADFKSKWLIYVINLIFLVGGIFCLIKGGNQSQLSFNKIEESIDSLKNKNQSNLELINNLNIEIKNSKQVQKSDKAIIDSLKIKLDSILKK